MSSKDNFIAASNARLPNNGNRLITAEKARDNFEDLSQRITFLKDHSVKFGITTNLGNSYRVTLEYPDVLTGGHPFMLRFNTENTGAATCIITPDGSTALDEKPLTDVNGDDFESGDLKVGQNRVFTYDATDDKIKEVGNVKEQSTAPTIGSYVPTLTNGSNVTSTSVVQARYQRFIGNPDQVCFQIQLELQPTNGLNVQTQCRISLPIISTFASEGDVIGTINAYVNANARAGIVRTVTSTNEIEIEFDSLSATDHTIQLVGSYPIQ